MKNISSGKWGIDTQLLLYSLDDRSPFQAQTRQLFHQIYKEVFSPVIAQQNMIEAERVLYRVYQVPLSFASEIIAGIVEDYSLQIVTPLPFTYRKFHEILKTASTKKTIDIFDYYLAATLMDNGVSRLLTVNTLDFTDIPDFTSVNPFK